VVIQAGEDGAEDFVVQRLRRQAGARAPAALQRCAPAQAPAPAAARLHAGVQLAHPGCAGGRWPEPPVA
jgi:hypothetical protein